MDNRHATVVSNQHSEEGAFSVSAQITGLGGNANSNENAANNSDKSAQTKFFKEISSHITNATHLHVTGTGQVQEQFIHYLAGTPQFKNSKTAESTSNKMSDEKLVEFITAKF